VRA
ncbi:branched-chain amino acid transport system / permease component family protein, partial [Vibrio parahaemolyticus EKP-008]|jgi:hypothetical protein